MKHVIICAGLLLALAGMALASEDGSRTPPVHRIPLYDEYGTKISPNDQWPMPFSVRETCGKCHDYKTISLGWHFNSSDPSVPAGRPGEPWVLVDEKTGTQIAVSNRDWPGAWKPKDLGMTPWKFTQCFGRHMPGGDMGQMTDEPADPKARWNVSGSLDINCLGCHNVDVEQNQSDWAIQNSRENFRWAPTAASGLGIVQGMASKVKPSWNPVDGPALDNPYTAPPSVKYNQNKFDPNYKCVLNLRKGGTAERCYFCHSTAPVGEEGWTHDGDVHLASGMTCTDCHRNGLAHHISRGIDAPDADPTMMTLTCRGCHYGEDKASEDGSSRGGRFGAPYPQHKGLPVVHLEKMACTSCHSGAWPKAKAGMIVTSRANRLGIHGKAKWATDLPEIASPVFKKDADGKLAPHNMFWPSFWARFSNGNVTPVAPEDIYQTAMDILEPAWQVGRVLSALGSEDDPAAIPVFVSKGKIYQTETAMTLAVAGSTEESAEPVWGLMRDGRVDAVVIDSATWTLESLTAAQGTLDYGQIFKILEQLGYDNVASGDPVYVANGKMYRWTDQNILAVEAAPEGAPAGWSDFAEKAFTALDPEVLKTSITAMLETEQSASQERIYKVLNKLSETLGTDSGEPVYLNNGKLFKRAAEGTLEEVPVPAGVTQAGPFWGFLAGSALNPLVPPFMTEAIASPKLTEEQVRRVLARLAEQGGEGDPVYVAGGKLHRLQGEVLTSEDHASAEPYAWAFGHDVRPAAQALGAGGCADCHSEDAPFFHCEVTANSPAVIGQASVIPMFKFEGFDESLLKGWVKSVKLRPLTVYGGGVVCVLLAIALLRYAFMAMEAILRAMVCKGGRKSA